MPLAKSYSEPSYTTAFPGLGIPFLDGLEGDYYSTPVNHKLTSKKG